jgi:hypothetical protein
LEIGCAHRPRFIGRGAGAGFGEAVFSPREVVMLDVIYVVSTIAFFGLMLAFVRGLEILGRESDAVEHGGNSSGGASP